MVNRFVCFTFACTLIACSAVPLPAPTSADPVSVPTTKPPPHEPEPCAGKTQLLVPLDGDFGLPFFEDGAYACRRFVPATYPATFTTARISWSKNKTCESAPRATYAVAPKDTLTGFSFAPSVLVPPTGFPTNGEFPISATVHDGEALFVCAILSTSPRSCVSSCANVGDPNSFWGDTGADGKTLVPPVLESLSASPTVAEAATYGNDKQRLMIEAW